VLSNEKDTLLKRVAPYEKLRAELDVKQALLAKNIADKRRMDKNLQFGQKVTTNQVQLRDFYNDMGASIPKSTWLDSIEYKSDNSVNIVGYAISDENILDYISALAKSDEVKEVALKTMELKPLTMRQLKVVMKLRLLN